MLDAPYVMPRIWDLTYAKEEGITGHTEGRTLPISSSEAKEHLDWTKAHPGGKMFLVYQVPGMMCPSAPSMLNGIDCVIVATYQPGPTPRSAQHRGRCWPPPRLGEEGPMWRRFWMRWGAMPKGPR